MRYLVLVAIALTPASVAWAHPAHVTLAEAEYDDVRGMLEVAIRVHPTDLEEALRRQAGRRIVLESQEADKQIVAYLQKTFAISTPGEKAAELRWVGKDLSVKHGWLYFEAPVPKDLIGLEVSNRMFFELLPDQVNTVVVQHGQKKATLQFTPAHPRRRLEW